MQMRYSRPCYRFALANREEASCVATGVIENTGNGGRHAVINYRQMMIFEGVNKGFDVLVELSEKQFC